jgi:sugar/nucleoside kinase (ribokinase family)
MAITGPILAIGDVRWETVQGEPRLGGWAAGFASRLAALGRRVDIAAAVGTDEAGSKAIQELLSLGLGTHLIQRVSDFATDSANVEISGEGIPTYRSLQLAAGGEVAARQDLMDVVNDYEVLYCNSYIHNSVVAGRTLQGFLDASPPSFKIYDVRMTGAPFARPALEAALGFASVFRVTSDDVPTLCQDLGLPFLEPEFFATAITERYGVSYCLVTDPLMGSAISSIVGEQISVPHCVSQVRDLLGWHDAFLAGFVHHVLLGSSLERCCLAGVHYADVATQASGAINHSSPEDITAIKAS